MKKITEAELSNRVSSLREKLILEAAPDAGKLNPDAKCTMCGNAYKNHFNFEPAGDPTGKVTSTKFRHPASPTDDFFPGLHETPADPVSGQTPEQAMQDPRYKTDPAFKAEVDAAAAIGTPPAAVTTPVPDPAPAVVTQLQPLAPAVAADSGTKVSGETPAVTPAVAPYVVKQGDNLTRIARQMGVTLQDLLKANPQFQAKGRNINLIYPGEKVNLPGTSAPAAPVSPLVPKAPAAVPKPAIPQLQYLDSARALTYPDRELTPDEKKRYGVASPVIRESVSYADDQTLARIVSLSRK